MPQPGGEDAVVLDVVPRRVALDERGLFTHVKALRHRKRVGLRNRLHARRKPSAPAEALEYLVHAVENSATRATLHQQRAPVRPQAESVVFEMSARKHDGLCRRSPLLGYRQSHPGYPFHVVAQFLCRVFLNGVRGIRHHYDACRRTAALRQCESAAARDSRQKRRNDCDALLVKLHGRSILSLTKRLLP